MATNSGASAGSVALAFLSGALLGAVTAVMLAPQTGRESRERVTGYARRTGAHYLADRHDASRLLCFYVLVRRDPALE